MMGHGSQTNRLLPVGRDGFDELFGDEPDGRDTSGGLHTDGVGPPHGHPSGLLADPLRGLAGRTVA